MQRRWYRKPSKQIQMVLLVSLLITLLIPQSSYCAINPVPSDLNLGPYIDKVIYKVITNQDQRILALQAGEIEMDTTFVDPVHLEILAAEPDIEYYSALRNGYGLIDINCEKYPLNISDLRRAFAFSFDKTAITVDIMDGLSQEHDSLVPYTNGWCIEDEFEWHYYDDRSDIGNQILDDLGFTINVTSGFRLAPNGESFKIEIEYSSAGSEIAGGTCQIGVDALHRLHIDADAVPVDFNEYIIRLNRHQSYDMVFYATDFYSNDVDWLAYDYWSEYADVEYQNPTNFRNATYDAWREQLLYGTTYEEVYEAAAAMQKILHYNVPRLVVYENIYIQMYRDDIYVGHVEDLAKYITGPWTMRKIHKIDGSFGGTVPIAISEEFDSFNFFVTDNSISGPSYAVLNDNIHSSLYRYGPDLNPWPDLAENILTETHSDNPAIQEGHTRFTINIIQNATWSDGELLTAEDVAFTFTYQFESEEFGNPAGSNMGDLYAVYTPSSYRVILEFATESYWHFSNFAFDKIVPQHVFNDDTGIGYEGWNTWNPIYNPSEPFVTCGPYILSDIELGESYEISWNPEFQYGIPARNSWNSALPLIGGINNIAYYVGTSGNEIVWPIIGSIENYSIFMNGSLRESNDWDGETIHHNIDGLEIGTYLFTLDVQDNEGNSDTNTILVYVREHPILQLLTPERIVSLLISSASILVIIVVTVLTYKERNS